MRTMFNFIMLCSVCNNNRLLVITFLSASCFASSGVVSTVKHVVSALAGMFGLFLFFEQHMQWILLLTALCYFILLLCRHSSSHGLFVSGVVLIYILTG